MWILFATGPRPDLVAASRRADQRVRQPERHPATSPPAGNRQAGYRVSVRA